MLRIVEKKNKTKKIQIKQNRIPTLAHKARRTVRLEQYVRSV